MAKQKKQIEVENKVISIISHNEEDYICLTDMVRGEDGQDHIKNWMRNRNTVEFLGIWEQIHNSDFKGVEFDQFRKDAGLNSFVLSPKKWIETTNAIGIISKSGRYGGTYAHQDIALEFGSWLSPTFKIYLIKEYRRLKEVETNKYNIEWSVRRLLSKTNYTIHTDAIKEHIIPKSTQPKNKNWLEYAEEADLLNVALFGYTAKEWREVNTEAAQKGLNMRDFASINELIVLSNIESMNATMINKGLDKFTRFSELRELVEKQISILNKSDTVRAIKKLDDRTYLDKGK
ncbi:KilA-N domain-containing protein (plasmid) [Bernardetia sp. OM2101]|uniref:KilA-N domain-containing protein n=1 Tax=Bernardetia sp. OM2101 TaxID=3344876 RepID=UPI0035D03951